MQTILHHLFEGKYPSLLYDFTTSNRSVVLCNTFAEVQALCKLHCQHPYDYYAPALTAVNHDNFEDEPDQAEAEKTEAYFQELATELPHLLRSVDIYDPKQLRERQEDKDYPWHMHIDGESANDRFRIHQVSSGKEW